MKNHVMTEDELHGYCLLSRLNGSLKSKSHISNDAIKRGEVTKDMIFQFTGMQLVANDLVHELKNCIDLWIFSSG